MVVCDDPQDFGRVGTRAGPSLPSLVYSRVWASPGKSPRGLGLPIRHAQVMPMSCPETVCHVEFRVDMHNAQ